jgi:hypothetical protein
MGAMGASRGVERSEVSNFESLRPRSSIEELAPQLAEMFVCQPPAWLTMAWRECSQLKLAPPVQRLCLELSGADVAPTLRLRAAENLARKLLGERICRGTLSKHEEATMPSSAPGELSMTWRRRRL